MTTDPQNKAAFPHGVIDRRSASNQSTWTSDSAGDFDLFDSMIFSERRIAGNPLKSSSIDYLGKAMYLCFIFVILSGCALLFGYRPTPDGAFTSIAEIQNAMPGGWWIRGLHRYATDFFIVLAILRIARIWYRRAYRFHGRSTWITSITMLLVALYGALTGFYLAWKQHGQWYSNWLGNSSDYMNDITLNSRISQAVISASFAWHIGIGIALLLFVLFWRFRPRRKSPKFRDFNIRVPRYLALGILGALTILALVLPPGTESLGNPSIGSAHAQLGWMAYLFQKGNEIVRTSGGISILMFGLLIILTLPWLDRYRAKGPVAAVTALLIGFALTIIVLLTSLESLAGRIWLLYLIITLIWIAALGYGIAGESISSKSRSHRRTGSKN